MKAKKFLATVLCFVYVAYSCPAVLLASTITGVTPVDNVYTIEAEKVEGSTGFRAYEDFQLDDGDIANLVFKDGYHNFVNIVDNQVSIDGIVNTMKGDAFYDNGRAIFVSHSGIVVGASGVLNVGSLNLINTSEEQYGKIKKAFDAGGSPLEDYGYGSPYFQDLVTNAAGDVIVKGIVLSRDEIEADGNSVTLTGTAGENGMVAGWTDSSTAFTDRATALGVFQSLVSGNVTDALALSKDEERGTITLSAVGSQTGDNDKAAPDNGISSSVTLEDTAILGNSISILADTKLGDATLPIVAFGKGVYFDYSNSDINITGSSIKGSDVDIKASASTGSQINAIELPEVLLAWLIEAEDDPSKVEEEITSLFSSEPYDDFAGARSYSQVTIDSSKITAGGNLNVTTDSQADYVVKTTGSSEGAIPFQSLLHALGTETKSTVDVNNSTLNAAQTADLKALSGNSLNMQASNDNGMFKLSETDAFSFQFLDFSTIVNTKLNITDSTVTAGEISARTLSNVDNYVYIDNSATVLKNDFSSPTQGGSGAAIIAIVNNSKTENEVNIKNSTLEATASDKNLTVEAVSVQNIDVTGKTRTNAEGAKKKEEITDSNSFFGRVKERFSNFGKIGKEAYSKYKSVTYSSWYKIFQGLKSGASDSAAQGAQTAVGEGQQLDPGLFQVGASFLFSNNTNNTAVNISDNSVLKSSQDVDINTHLLDKYHNVAFAHAKQPEDASQSTAIAGAGVALVVNNRNNSSTINITGSTVNAEKDLNVNALTELPGISGTLGLDSQYFALGLSFGSDASDEWSFQPKAAIGPESDRAPIVPQIGLSGFFNNATAAGTTGDDLAVAASITYNNDKNDTKVNIKDSTIDVGGNVRTYAANSVATRSDAGFFGSTSIINYDEAMDIWNSDGTGASVLVQTVENNAVVNVENSQITAKEDVGLNAASEQSYINFVKMFTSAPTVASGGAVSVQDYTGKTAVNVLSGSTLTAKNVKLESGKARESLGKLDENGLPVIEDDKLVLVERRTSEDHITTVDVVGEISKQESGEQKEVTAAVGAAVNVKTLGREIHALLDNSTITASKDVTIDSRSYNRSIELALAGSLSGGASAQTQNVASWQKKADKSAKTDDFFAEMMSKIDDAFPEGGEGEAEQVIETAKDSAQKVGGSKYSFSIAGSVNVLENNTSVSSIVRNGATVSAQNGLTITSDLKNLDIILGGGFAKSKTVGTGAAVNILSRGGSVETTVSGSKLEVGLNTDIEANEDNEIYSIAVGVGYTGDSSEEDDTPSFDGAIGGSFVYNSVESGVSALVEEGADVEGTNYAGNSVTVLASQDVDTFNFAGALAVEEGSKFSAGAALAGTTDYLKSDVTAAADSAKFEGKINSVSVHASEENNLTSLGVALDAVGNYAKWGTPFDGSLGLVMLENNINARVKDTEMAINGKLDVDADNVVKTMNLEGSGAFSQASSGLGVGGGLIFNIQKNNVGAEIDKGTAKTLSAKEVNASAHSFETVNNIPVTVGISKQTSMLASTVVLDLIENQVSATLRGDDLKAMTGSSVKAFDESYLLTRGGTLAAAGGEAVAVLGVSVNIDKLAKNVDASIDGAKLSPNSDQQLAVTVSADSVDAIGGTRKDDGSYDRDDISNPDYQEKLLAYDDKNQQYSDLKRDDVDESFKNWNMLYNLGFGAKSAITGALAVKLVENNVNAELANGANVTADSLNVHAGERIVKNLLLGSISATENLGVGAQVVYTHDAPVVNAMITGGSATSTSHGTTVSASDVKDNNTVVVAGTVSSQGGSVGLNILSNAFDDQVNAKVDSGSTVSGDTVSVQASEDVNSTRVVVQATASKGVAIGLQPLENDYNESVNATVDGSTVSNADAAVQASADHKTRDITVGVAAAAQGVSLSGIEIRNNYGNSISSAVTSSTADLKSLAVSSGNHIWSDNWAVILDGVGQGVSLGANVMINDAKFTTLSQVRDSLIKASGDVSVSTDSGKDTIRNTTGAIGFTAQGVAADANLILNTYSDVSKASVSGSEITAGSLSVRASGERELNNRNLTVVAVAEGAGLGGSVTYNSIASDTEAEIDADDKQINVTGTLAVDAEDTTTVDQMTGTGAIAAAGGAAMANVVITKEKGTAKAALASSGSGMFTAGAVNVGSELDIGVNDSSAGISLGIGTLAGAVKLVTIGEKTAYTDLEKNGGMDSAVSAADDRIGKLMGKNLSEDTPSGAYSDINAVVEGTEGVLVHSQSNIYGTGDDGRMKLNNLDFSASGASAGVGILSLTLNGTSSSTISGGSVSSTDGNVMVHSMASDVADLQSSGISLGGLVITGGTASYNDNTNSIATISDAVVTGKNVLLRSGSDSDATVQIGGINLGGVSVNVSGYETNVAYSSQALVTGKTDIDTTGMLDINSASNVNVSSAAQFAGFTSGAGVTYMSNNVGVTGNTTALVKDAEGKIKAGKLNITTSYDTLSAQARNNVVSVSGAEITVVNGGVSLSPVFTSGIDNLGKDLKIVADNTSISTGLSNNGSSMTAKTGIDGTGVALLGFAAAQSESNSKSNAVSSTLVKSDSFTTGKLNVNAHLNSDSEASDGGTTISTFAGVTGINVSSSATDSLNIAFEGTMTIGDSSVIKAAHTSRTSVAADSLDASLFANVSSLNLTADNNSDTSVSLKGNIGLKDILFDIVTDRDGVLNSSSKSGGAVSVASRKFSNSVTGTSELTLDGLKATGSDNTGAFTVKLASDNMHDDVSRSSNGGFFAYESSDYNYNFDTVSKLNVKDSDIEGFGSVNLGVDNINTISDSSVTKDGGFIVLVNARAGHSFSSASELTVDGSTLSAGDIKISAASSDNSHLDKELLFKGESGGFYTEDDLELNNTLTQKNDVSVSNSTITGTGNVTLALATGQDYRQKVEDLSDGFIANPTIKSWLTSNNTNNLVIDEKSTVRADSALNITLDVNGKLSTYSHVEVKDAGSDPESDSHLAMNADNTVTIKGRAEGGSLNLVNFMGSSNNDLHQESYSEHYAVAPFTTEAGELKRTINNTLTVTGESASGQALTYQFNSGTGDLYASNHYHCVYYAAFGYETYGETSSNKDLTTNNKADIPGKISAGIGNSKFLFVHQDGTVDNAASVGVYDHEYVTYGTGNDRTSEEIKEIVLGAYDNHIDSLSDELERIDNHIQDNVEQRASLAMEKNRIEGVLDAVDSYMEKGYILETEQRVMATISNDLLYRVSNALENPISTDEFSDLYKAYEKWLSGETGAANGDFARDITYYVNYVDKSLTDGQKGTFITAAGQILENMKSIEAESNDGFAKVRILAYEGHNNSRMISAVYDDGTATKDYIAALQQNKDALEDRIAASEARHAELQSAKNLLSSDLERLNAARETENAKPLSEFGQDTEEFAVLFHSLKSNPGTITITGIDKEDIMVNGEAVGDDLSLLSDHVLAGKRVFTLSNYSQSVVMDNGHGEAGDDGIRFTVNGVDLSEHAGTMNYVRFTRDGVSVIINEEDVSIHNDADIQLYTSKTGSFSFDRDQAGVITTSAPVVYSNPNLIVRSYLGYHSFDSFAYSESSALASGVKLVLTGDFMPQSDDSDELEIPLIVDLVNDASARRI